MHKFTGREKDFSKGLPTGQFDDADKVYKKKTKTI